MFATEDARKTINAWISANTAGKIDELFAPGVLDETTLMVLANAIYFKGKWFFSGLIPGFYQRYLEGTVCEA